MTKNKIPALLTVQDVKSFIFEAINAAEPRKTLTQEEFMDYFNVTRPTIARYLEKGMPWTGSQYRKKFVVRQVKKWFFENDIQH